MANSVRYLAYTIIILNIYTSAFINSRSFLSRNVVKLFATNKAVKVEVPLGDGFKEITAEFKPIFESSEFIVTTYDVPFSLNVEPEQGLAIVTKDGKGGEKVGDILRATTCWSQGFEAAGATSDIMMFAGNVRWRKGLFATAGAPWQQIVDSLLSNTAERSKTVTLVFERETEEDENKQV